MQTLLGNAQQEEFPVQGQWPDLAHDLEMGLNPRPARERRRFGAKGRHEPEVIEDRGSQRATEAPKLGRCLIDDLTRILQSAVVVIALIERIELPQEQNQGLQWAVVQLVRHAPALLFPRGDRVSGVALEALLALVLERHIAEHHLGATTFAGPGQRRCADCLNPYRRPSATGWQGPRAAIRWSSENVL